MNKRPSNPISIFLKKISQESKDFFEFFLYYLRRKVMGFSSGFEKNKNRLVKFFIMKRGRYNRPFLHLTTMGVLLVGVLIAPVLADTFPIFISKASALDLNASSNEKQSILVGEEVFQTEISKKPRDKVITYVVEKGDTIDTIAKKFGISQDTIRWSNDMQEDDLSIGEEIKILPVTGIAHTVADGETIHSIAKKFDTDAQKIVDFPFNEFTNPETFSVVAGQTLIVPDGIKPSEQPFIKRQVYIAQGPISVASGGYTYPIHGEISQSFSWYHPGLDIVSPMGTPIVAAHNGTVSEVHLGTYDGGYGNNVYISNGNGVVSHYAHMSGANVSVGQSVIGGRTIVGWIGMTGRTTGPHLHFEIRRNGGTVDPLGYIQ